MKKITILFSLDFFYDRSLSKETGAKSQFNYKERLFFLESCKKNGIVVKDI